MLPFVTLQLVVPLQKTFLETEETLQSALNEAGTLVSGEALKQLDSDGSPIESGGERWTSKGQLPKTYQTPYGMVEIQRHVYQTSDGGKTLCPLEVDARMIITSTPKFAQQISHKYAQMSSVRLVEDLRENHGPVHRSFVQTLAEAIGTIALLKEEDWHYQTPKLPVAIETVSIGVDGTCMLLCEDGWRQAMVGTISLYDRQGERQHTTYIAAAPERGRDTFLARMQREVEQVKQLYPQAHYQGLADGAAENWKFLEPLTHTQVLDFYHATQYLAKVAKAVHPRRIEYQQAWMDTHCHTLKHEVGAATRLLAEMEAIEPANRLSEVVRSGLFDAITYFRNHHHQMHYAEAVTRQIPIGSGVTEAACKVIVKARLCGAGMKWKGRGAGIVLSLRTLTYTQGRWQQFWSKINRYGFTLA